LAVLSAAEKEKKMEEMHLSLVHQGHKDALMVLSVLDFVL
jgi:hypothetical protein